MELCSGMSYLSSVLFLFFIETEKIILKIFVQLEWWC